MKRLSLLFCVCSLVCLKSLWGSGFENEISWIKYEISQWETLKEQGNEAKALKKAILSHIDSSLSKIHTKKEKYAVLLHTLCEKSLEECEDSTKLSVKIASLQKKMDQLDELLQTVEAWKTAL